MATMTPPTRRAYGFEHIIRFHCHALHDKKCRYYNTFIANLNLEAPANLADEALLHEYVASVHVNACWYNRKVRSEKFLQAVFFAISMALLGLVPILVYSAPKLFDAEPSAAVTLGARIPILLAGFYAVHRSMSSWITQRKFISPYWNARSQLVNEIYTIETDWRSRDKQSQPSAPNAGAGPFLNEFTDALKRSIGEARKIVQEERTTFFQNYTFPDIDLSGVLSTAATNAAATIASFESPIVKKRRERQAQVDELQSDAEALAIKSAQLATNKENAETELQAATAGSPAHIALKAEVKRLAEALGLTQAEHKLASANLLEAEAKLRALRF